MAMLTKSPLFIGLRHRFAGRRSSGNSYDGFTTAFDQIVDASDPPVLLRKQTGRQARNFEEAVTRPEGESRGERVTIGVAAAKLVRDLQIGFS
jgi:hypothetical protein